VAAVPLSDNPERVRRVFVNQNPLAVEHASIHRGQVIFKLSGVNSIADAKPLVGADICIPLDERPAAPEGEYYQTDLIGCAVVDPAGRPIGTVRNWREYGGTPLLGVLTAEGKELLVPFAKSICTGIDVIARRIVAELPEGLADLD